jgi:hypothetical protein
VYWNHVSKGEPCSVGGRAIANPKTAQRFARYTTDRPITSISYCYFAILSDITWTSFLSA